jgi:hypothetical protein
VKIDKKADIFSHQNNSNLNCDVDNFDLYGTKIRACASLRTYSRRQFFAAPGKTWLPKINCFDGLIIWLAVELNFSERSAHPPARLAETSPFFQ